MMGTIQELKKLVSDFVCERDWNEAHNPKNISMSIAIEASELMEIFQWKTLEQSINIKESDEYENLREEIADVMIYCLSMANILDIDLDKEIKEKIKKNAIKYPIKSDLE